MAAVDGQETPGNRADRAGRGRGGERVPHGIVAVMGRVALVFLVLTVWCFALSIAYAYGGEHGLLGWIRLPEGLAPFQRLNLAIADVGALAALFVAILLASTVQLNSTVTAADDIADDRPTTAAEARHQQHRLRFYANQAEMSMVASFLAAFAVLMLTVLFGLADTADRAEASEVDIHGVGWEGFLTAAAVGLTHPRFVTMYLVSFLLFLITYSSLPEWKSTGLFRRQVEDNAWDAAERLRQIARRHSLADVDAIRCPRWAAAAAVVGYVAYVSVFALVLNLSLALFVGGDGFAGAFSAGHRLYFLLFALLGAVVSTAVGTTMLWVHHLHGQKNLPLIVSLALGVAALLYVVSGEGVAWFLTVGTVVTVYAAWWAWLYWRGVRVLDEKDPAGREFLLNPPKFIVAHRYEAIRRSAALLEHPE